MSDIEIVLTVGVAVVSAILAYGFGRRNAHDDRRQRAKEIATALLIELRYAEKSLRSIYEEERPHDYRWYTPLPWFERLFPEARFLSPGTMRAAYEFYGLVLEVRARLDMLAGVKDVPDHLHYEARVKAGFAVERLGHLVDELAKDGGVLPPVYGVKQVSQGQLPTLPPIRFPEALVGEEVAGPAHRPTGA